MRRREFLTLAGLAGLGALSEVWGVPMSLETAACVPHVESLERYNLFVRAVMSDSLEQRAAAIVIEKCASTLLLFERGLLRKRYGVELGKSPLLAKEQEGDNRTPEGVYRIVRKKPRAAFGQALLLDYPTLYDKIRFAELQRAGIVSRTASIGGSIAIHGRGDAVAKGNWTQGCIALPDEEMREVYKRVAVGTPVAIVRYQTVF